MKRSTARVALPQSKLAGTVAGVAVCALDGTTPAPPKAAATKRRKPPKRMSRPLVTNDNVRIIAQVLEADRQRITAAVLFLEQDQNFISADSGAAGDGKGPPMPGREAVITEWFGIEFDAVGLAQRDVFDAAVGLVHRQHPDRKSTRMHSSH